MSPLHINILLHYYAKVDDFTEGTPEFAINQLVYKDMLRSCTTDSSKWKLTKRGEFYVKHLMTIPIPESNFVINLQDESVEINK